MVVGSGLPSGAALRSNPTQFKNLADDFEGRRAAVLIAAAKLRETGVSYAVHHSGPDIDVISNGLSQAADAYDDRVSGYAELSDAFETTYNTLVRLEQRSETLDRQRSTALSSDTYGDVGATLLNATSELVEEFDAIQQAERTALVALGNTISSVSFGSDIAYDAASWQEIIERAVEISDEPDFQLELRTGYIVVADHSTDGTIDEEGISSELSEKVVEARTRGLTSEEVGLPAVLFPSGYDDDVRRIRELEHDDHGNVPWLGNPSDDELAEAAEIREKLGLNDDPDVRRIQIISETAELHGADEWKGQELGNIYEENLIETSGPRPSVTDLSDEAVELLGEEISDNPNVSVSFFNEIGAQNTAEIPSVLDGKSELIKPFSESLGDASQKGKPRLRFTGSELIEAVEPGSTSWPPETLFIEGDFESGFLAEATQASIERRNGDELPTWNRHFDGDPTNIMLARAAENPEAAQQTVQGLEDDGLIHLLIEPEVRYDPVSDNSEPVADFLGVAGKDKDTAKILLGNATKAAEFSDPGVAAGFDRIMGHHATVMYDETYLTQHGIDPAANGTISQEEWLEWGFTSDDWGQLQKKTLDHGQGSALVDGNDELIRQAIAHDLQPDNDDAGEGEINNDYTRFGLTSGVLERNYIEAILDVEAQKDADNEEFNRRVSATRSTALAFGGPAGSAADIYLGYYWDELDGAVKDTDHEKQKLADLLAQQLGGDTAENRFERIAEIEAIRAAEIRADQARVDGLTPDPIVDVEGNPVRLVEIDGKTAIEVRDAETGEWEVRMTEFQPKDEYPDGPGIGDTGVTAGDKLGDPYEKASKVADPTRGEDAAQHIGDIEEADIWAPILPERTISDSRVDSGDIIIMPGFVTGG